MKKLLAILLAAMMLLSLAACGGQTGTPQEGETQQGAETDPGDEAEEPQEPEAPEEPEAQEEASTDPQYEVTYQKARTYTDSIGTTWVQSIVEITNTGSVDLYLDSGAYDLEDADGNLVASQSMVSTYPSVLAPGEKGYMYEETTLDGYSGEGELTIIPRPDVEKASVDLIRYNISDVSVAANDYGGVKVIGRIENATEEAGKMVYIVAFFYDAAGTPIGSAFTILTEDLAAGAKQGFELTGFSLPDDVTPDVISDTVVYAYPLQMQF